MYTLAEENVRMFSKELEKTFRLLAGGGSSLRLTPVSVYRLIRHETRNRKLLKAVRRSTALCGESCQKAPCLTNICEDVRRIRDGYLKLLAIVSQWPILSLFASRIESSLDDWDDLAEDCTIGSDEEFRSLILQIAEHA